MHPFLGNIFMVVTALSLPLSAFFCRMNSASSLESEIVSFTGDYPEEEDVFYKREWKNPKTFVLDKPSSSQISSWKKACESYNPDGNYFEVYSYMYPLESYLAFRDLDQVRYQERESGLIDSFEFFCWRLNELSPQDPVNGECERYAALQRQIEALLEYQPDASSEICNMASMRADFEEMRADYYCERLCSQMPQLKGILKAENEAFHVYASAAYKAFSKIVMGDPDGWGTISAVALGAFSELVASEYTTALVPFFLNISDPQKASLPEKYGIVTDDMIERAYEIFRSSIKENAELYAILETDIPGEYSTRSLQKDLDEDHAAWNEWMKARSKVLSSLSGDSRDIYERCTNNVKRGHLISLLNRYEESDIVSGGYYDILLKRDCTDKQLREYDFDSAYTEYMKRFR